MNNRQQQIKKMLEAAGEVHLQNLKKVFPEMSEMTLRRDLSLLESEGYAIRTHGGAVSTNKIDIHDGQENEYSKRAREGVVAKTGIAAKAVRFIEKGRSIYLDAGSTVMSLAKLIEGDGCTFVTSAVNTALKISSTAHSVIQLGGAVNKNTLSCSGPDALLMMDALNIDVAIMSASGFSLDRGFTISNRYESLLKQKVLKKAKKIVVLMDSSKIDKDLTFTFASLEDIDYWVCNDTPGKEIEKKCREFGVELV
ncbi:MAG: DeoR/GlpR family DNA-binding transcription regulator [Clostridia bacterium]|nr:DeoR/GlpR family DNA-binding transcription regulator [Clostridia bacterium]